MRILYASSEISPFATTGGLGEVCGALPRALHGKGMDILRVMPLYRQAAEGKARIEDTGIRLRIPVGFNVHTAEIWLSREGGVTTYLIRRDEYFDRSGIYGPHGRDYDDNFERFVFFQKAAVGLVDTLQWPPDIVHGNDWTTGLMPFFLRAGVQGTGRKAPGGRCVTTIHNLAHQGLFDAPDFSLTHLPFSLFSIQGLEFYGKINCLKAGLTGSEAVTTVSRSYATETLEPAHGFGLDGVLRSLGDRYSGIQNGVEYEDWDPARDPGIARAYSAEDPAGKAECKKAWYREAGYRGDAKDTLLLGMIARLVDQKGLDILSEAMPGILRLPVRIALLGSGCPRYETACREWQERWPGRVRTAIGYDEGMARRIQSASDALLMPSKYEPSGLSQLHAMKYGTAPVVHATGGLADTVEDLSADGQTGTGFSFGEYSAAALVRALRRAAEIFFRQPDAWRAMQGRMMARDFSWDGASEQYIALYRKIASEPAREIPGL